VVGGLRGAAHSVQNRSKVNRQVAAAIVFDCGVYKAGCLPHI
jgi:hypothetical protein